ncbi:MAG: GMC family oxidoreductase N-terminal domain-containing protein, partial [Deltaproteobacteria bacterium]|nr:GMC family oxidoreductase N-terminal domain-containing protein [Deltaproteobacteria bacterium]
MTTGDPVLRPRELVVVRAIGEVLLPAGGPVTPSADAAGVTGYIDGYLAKIPARQRRLLRLLLAVIDWGAILLRPGLRRFTALSILERERYLRGWESSRLYFRRAAFTSLRAVFTMAYLADEEVQRQLGMTSRGVCADVVPAARGRDFHAGVKTLEEYRCDWEDEADVVIVGSGPGGAVIARELAEKGRSVILIEEGPVARRERFTTEVGESMHRFCREDGLTTAVGNVFLPTIHGRCLGGSSVINSAICSRPPASIFAGWQERHGTEA